MMNTAQILLALLCLPITAAVAAPYFCGLSGHGGGYRETNARREEYDRLVLVGEDLSADYAMGRIGEDEFKQNSARLAEQLARVAEDQ